MFSFKNRTFFELDSADEQAKAEKPVDVEF